MAIQFLINGIDVTSQVLMNTVSISDQINQKTNTITFTTEKYLGGGYKPELNHEIEVFQDSQKIFGGVLISYNDEIISHNVLRYSVKGKDYTQYLDRKLVTERFNYSTVSDIVTSLLSTYAPDFTSLVSSDVVISSMSFNRLTISQCLEKMANALSFVWWVDYDKNVRMVKKNEEVAPFSLSDTAGNHHFDSLVIEKDLSQIRNIVIIEGGNEISDPQTVSYFGDGETMQYDTMYKFAEKPTFVVDGVTMDVGVDNLNDPLDYDAMWSFNEKYLKLNTIIPTLKDPSTDSPNVVITGKPLFPILVRVPDPVSIGNYGEYEFAIKDNTIQTRQQGIDRAIAELKAYASTISEGGFSTNKYGLHSGQTINIASVLRDINENFIIQRVNTRFIGDGTEEIRAEYQIDFATLKTVGIIDVLQKLLLDEDITDGERDILLIYLQFQDELSITHDDVIISTQTPPYRWDSDGSSTTPALWGYSTYE